MNKDPNSKPTDGLAQLMGHSFSDQNLLYAALTHPSLEGEGNYQRLEFLGDHILGMVIADLLFQKYPNEREGRLTRRHTALVRKETLAEIALTLDLGAYIRMTDTTERGGGRTNPSILSDVLEALIAALYLDAGAEAVKIFIHKNWAGYLNRETVKKDSKTALQEWAQGRGLPLPDYTLISRSGPDHAPRFVVEVTVEGSGSAQAKGASKQAAEIEAATGLFQKLTSKK